MKAVIGCQDAGLMEDGFTGSNVFFGEDAELSDGRRNAGRVRVCVVVVFTQQGKRHSKDFAFGSDLVHFAIEEDKAGV